jgi:hypothetical protein
MGALYQYTIVEVDATGYGEQVAGGIVKNIMFRQVLLENFPAVGHCLFYCLGLGEDGGKANQPPEMGEIYLE